MARWQIKNVPDELDAAVREIMKRNRETLRTTVLQLLRVALGSPAVLRAGIQGGVQQTAAGTTNRPQGSPAAVQQTPSEFLAWPKIQTQKELEAFTSKVVDWAINQKPPISPERAARFVNHYAGQGGLVGNGRPMTNWQAKLMEYRDEPAPPVTNLQGNLNMEAGHGARRQERKLSPAEERDERIKRNIIEGFTANDARERDAADRAQREGGVPKRLGK
jgi:hypothetical protein